jgi:hypothetical protein
MYGKATNADRFGLCRTQTNGKNLEGRASSSGGECEGPSPDKQTNRYGHACRSIGCAAPLTQRVACFRWIGPIWYGLPPVIGPAAIELQVWPRANWPCAVYGVVTSSFAARQQQPGQDDDGWSTPIGFGAFGCELCSTVGCFVANPCQLCFVCPSIEVVQGSECSTTCSC